MRIRNLITAVASGNLRRGDRHDTAGRRGPDGPTCTSICVASVCQTGGNAQVTATHPPVNYQSRYPFFGPYPYGLLFDNGGHHR
jgi:hypothetical protein